MTPRGFCLDVVGWKQRADPGRGLHAHSCYSYQGQIAVDQGFDAALVRAGTFRLTGFEVCMTLPAEHRGETATSLRGSGAEFGRRGHTQSSRLT
jgi:hypothetical protein